MPNSNKKHYHVIVQKIITIVKTVSIEAESSLEAEKMIRDCENGFNGSGGCVVYEEIKVHSTGSSDEDFNGVK